MYCNDEKPKKRERTSKGYNQQWVEWIKKKLNKIEGGVVSSQWTREVLLIYS